MEFLAWALLSTPFVDRTTSFLSKRYCTSKRYPYPWMILHISSATTLLLRYYLMNKVDIPVAAAFSLSAIGLQNFKEKIRPPVYRATFRASILLQAIVFVLAFTGWPHLGDSGVRFLWWFTTTRLGAVFMYFTPGFTKGLAHKADLLVLSSALVSVWYADLSVGWYMLLVLALLWTDQKLSGAKKGMKDQAPVTSLNTEQMN